MKVNKLSDSEVETKGIAKEIIEKYQGQISYKCLVLALEGDLGTGKTVFAKGIADALGIKKVIRSPSFIIMREFPYLLNGIKGIFFHIDLWRMRNEIEVRKLRMAELVKPENVLLIEWAERMENLWPEILNGQENILVKIKIKSVGESKRKIEIIY